MAFFKRKFISSEDRAIQGKQTGDPSQPETSEGPVLGAEEATEDKLDTLAADVFGTGEPSQHNDTEQAASPGSSEEGEASTRFPLGSESLEGREGEAAYGSSETSSPPLSPAHIDYHAGPEDQLKTETQGLPEGLADSPREASSGLINVQDRISETLKDIFDKKVEKDPLLKALLEIHGEVDLRKLAAELGDFAVDIGARKRQL